MLFIKLPSGRLLSYVKPRIGENQYGGKSVTYEGVESTKKWESIECSPIVDLDVICKQMVRSPDWMPDTLLRADGYETDWYRKD